MHEVPVVTAGIAGAFAELRIAALRFVMSVRTQQLGSHWKDFHDIFTFECF